VPDAVAQLEEALRLKPDDAEAHSNMASALQFQGRLAEALQHAREAERQPTTTAHFNLGNVLNATGQVEDAVRELRRATQINPRMRTPTSTSRHRRPAQPD
jgi:tetratricopeptide (TPR) repeat protein